MEHVKWRRARRFIAYQLHWQGQEDCVCMTYMPCLYAFLGAVPDKVKVVLKSAMPLADKAVGRCREAGTTIELQILPAKSKQ